MAAGEGRLQLVKLLLDHGADPAAVDNRGNTGAGEVSGQPLKTHDTKIMNTSAVLSTSVRR